MRIKAGEKLPKGTFHTMTSDGVAVVTTEDIFNGKRVVLFAVPAVFTPGCTKNHLPSYINHCETIQQKGFDTIACLSVSDAYVMQAWAETTGAAGRILMLADGNAEFVRKVGLENDLSKYGMGMRCQRFSMIVEHGTVKRIEVDLRAIESTDAITTCGLERKHQE